jgi:hypothetical protein
LVRPIPSPRSRHHRCNVAGSSRKLSTRPAQASTLILVVRLTEEATSRCVRRQEPAQTNTLRRFLRRYQPIL